MSITGLIPCLCLDFRNEVNFGRNGLPEELEHIAELLVAGAMAHVVIRFELDIVLVLFKQLHRLPAIFVPNHLK